MPRLRRNHQSPGEKCRFCSEFFEDLAYEQALGDQVDQDKINAQIGDRATDLAVGKDTLQAHTGEVKGTFIQAQGDVTLGPSKRDAPLRFKGTAR